MRSVALLSGLIAAGLSACVLSGGAAAKTEGDQTALSIPQTTGSDIAVGATEGAFDAFLDRLMHAESNGLSHAKNPRSTALGPFQFINSTFLAVMRNHFPDVVGRLSERAILALRTKHDVARQAAKAFSKDNMAYLVERGVTPTFGHLRLAFLLGPEGAARVLKASPGQRVARVLEGGVIAANPFMRGMTVADLVARATRDVSPKPSDQPAPSATIVAQSAPQAPAADAADTKAAPAPQPADPKVAAAATDTKTDVKADTKADDGKVADVAEASPKVAVAKSGETRVAEAATVAAPAPLRAGRITARRLDRPAVAVINVKCDERLASCQRWINREVAKLVRVAEK